tara:strand:+ start:144 stop:683 length:540 start_codon:yes stop_codon:yes gene_type:complete
MKITPKELKQIIKEELEAVKEKVVKRGDKYAYVSKKGKTLGTHDTKAGAEKQATAIRISRNVGESSLNEDGHTDVPSAIRKLKTSMEDAMQILSALEHMPDAELPSWWMSKITLAADYLNKSRDYLLVSEDKEYVKSFYTAKEKRADHLIDKGVDPDIAYGVADDQMAKAGKKIKRKKK